MKKIPKLMWGLLPKVDIVVFDDCNSSLLRNNLFPAGVKVSILYLRGEAYYVNPVVLFYTLFIWFKYKRSIGTSYSIAVINLFRPKMVVTYIDDNPLFGRVAKYVNAKFVAIQNGARNPSSYQKLDYLPVYFSIGEYEKEIALLNGVRIDEHYAVGSIRAWMFNDHFKGVLSKEFDICIIGQRKRPHFKANPWFQEQYEIMLKAIGEVCRINSFKTVLATRSYSNDDLIEEVAYHDKFLKLGDNLKIVKLNLADFSTFKTIKRSHLTITHSSTCGFEAQFFNEKVLFFDGNYRENTFLNYAKSSGYFMEKPDPDLFKNRILECYKMSKEEYFKMVGVDKEYYFQSKNGSMLDFTKNYIIKNLGDK